MVVQKVVWLALVRGRSGRRMVARVWAVHKLGVRVGVFGVLIRVK